MALTDNIYDKLTNSDDARACDDISERACRETPRSFTLILLSSICTKLGDAVASPKTTLAWITTAVGAPAYVLGFLVPLRESGSMLPQLFIGSGIRQLAIRKWVWVVGSVGQGLCIAGIGFTAIYLDGQSAGLAILGLIAVFSLARSLSSVAAKDVLGKTISKTRRGQLTGWSASIAGLISVGVAVVLMLPVASDLEPSQLGLLLVAAGALWFVAAVIYSQIRELPGETGGGRSALAAISKLRILVTDKTFGRFVATRALLMCSALSAPFYVALAVESYGSQGHLLGAFLASAGIASLVSAPVWGRFADSSSKNVMVAAALVTAAIGIATAAVAWLLPALVGTAWFVPDRLLRTVCRSQWSSCWSQDLRREHCQR